MTKLSAVAHLGIGGGGWTESKKANLDKTDFQPSYGTELVCGVLTQTLPGL